MLPELLNLMPKHFNRYFEPFVGGGALLFTVKPHDFVIGDKNAELINMYKVVKNHPQELIHLLKKHQEHNSKEYYLSVRSQDRDESLHLTDVERAARLIYMLKVDFNGLYRVNSKGQFNVPYGRYKNPNIIDKTNISSVSEFFNTNKCQIVLGDYQNTVKTATKGDFVYFDPPYVPVSKSANFTSYTKDGFNVDNQKELADTFFELKNKGVYVVRLNN